MRTDQGQRLNDPEELWGVLLYLLGGCSKDTFGAVVVSVGTRDVEVNSGIQSAKQRLNGEEMYNRLKVALLRCAKQFACPFVWTGVGSPKLGLVEI